MSLVMCIGSYCFVVVFHILDSVFVWLSLFPFTSLEAVPGLILVDCLLNYCTLLVTNFGRPPLTEYVATSLRLVGAYTILRPQ